MGIKCGIVGLPNVGKSTLFNALTKAGIAAANFPVLHDRAQHRRRAGAGSAPERAGRDRQAAADPADLVRVRRHRRPGGGRLQRRGPGQQVPGPHPRGGRHRPRGALLREHRHHPRQRQGRPDRRHRNHRYRTGAGRPGLRRKSAEPRRKARPRAGDKDAIVHETRCWRACAPASTQASRPARWACPTRTRRRSATCSC